MNKGRNAELIKKFNAGLENLKKSGQYDKIVNRYLGEGAANDDNSFFGLIKSTYPILLQGLKMTVILTVVSIAIALVLGVIFGLFRVSRSIVLRAIGTTFVDIFRGTPATGAGLLHLLRHPVCAGLSNERADRGHHHPLAECGRIHDRDRARRYSIRRQGQMEAARSLGIGYLPTMRKVILPPQAIRTMIPSYINQFVITLKDTSILSVIGIAELTQTGGRIIIAGNFQSFKMWLIIGIIYFIVIMRSPNSPTASRKKGS